MDDSCVLQLKIITVFFPHFVSPLAADNAIRSAPSSVRQEGGPFSPHPPDAFDVHARKGFRETAFFLPSFSFLPPPSRSYLTPSFFLSRTPLALVRSFLFLTRQAASAPMETVSHKCETWRNRIGRSRVF